MLNELCKKYEYLFDEQYRDIFAIYSVDEFNRVAPFLQPLVFVAGKGIEAQPIKECHEPMVPLRDLITKTNSNILLVAGEAEYGARDLAIHALRQSVAERLFVAEKMLRDFNPNFTFKITDSYRPLKLQKQYFDKIHAELAAQGFAGEELYNKTTQVIADPESHPPHSTGGTLDLTIHDIGTGKDLPMGSVLDGIDDPLARTFDPDIVGESRHNRLLLFAAMTEVGFVNSSSEWWHYSIGDREWAIHKHEPFAIYDSVVENQS